MALKQSIKWAVIAGLASWSMTSLASGFQLFEANGESTGNFGADMAAGTQDSSMAYFNPAALMYLSHPQMVASLTNLFYTDKFQGKTVWTNPQATNALNHTLNVNLPPSYTRYGKAEGGAYALIPGFDVATPINDSMAFGFAVAAPFGLKTTYDDNSFTNYSATSTSVYDIDYIPNLAFKFTHALTWGLGADLEYITADLNGTAGLPNLAQAQGRDPATYNTQSRNDASGWGYGWHTGLMYQFTPQTRVGLDYHSKVTVTVDGTSKFVGPMAGGPSSIASPNYRAIYQNNNLTATTTLPAWSQLGLHQKLSSEVAMDATVTYTEWGVFNDLTLNNVAAADNALNPTSITVVVPEHFRNTWRFGLGGSYQPCADPQWLFRAGVGYDQNPTNSYDRNVRLPDGNRYAAAIGTHYQATKNVGMDVGYTHIWFQDGAVHNTTYLGPQQATVTGKARSHADLIGLQLTWDFV